MVTEALSGTSTKLVAMIIGIAILVAIFYFNVLTILGISGILKDYGIDLDKITTIQEELTNAIHDFFSRLQEIFDQIIGGNKNG